MGKGRRKPPFFVGRRARWRLTPQAKCFSARTEASFEAATRRLKTRLGGSLTFANRRGASLDALRQWTEGDPLEARVFTHHLRRACRASRRGVGVAVELSG